jgi:HK97 gp10 family phage protein
MSFQVIINTSAFERAVERQVTPIMEGQLNTIRETMIEEFNAPKSGREYPRRRRASAPGEPPARQTGTLQASITEPQVRKSGNAIVGEMRITAPYAVFLERGTSRMAPRPFAQPAVDALLKGLGRIGVR